MSVWSWVWNLKMGRRCATGTQRLQPPGAWHGIPALCSPACDRCAQHQRSPCCHHQARQQQQQQQQATPPPPATAAPVPCAAHPAATTGLICPPPAATGAAAVRSRQDRAGCTCGLAAAAGTAHTTPVHITRPWHASRYTYTHSPRQQDEHPHLGALSGGQQWQGLSSTQCGAPHITAIRPACGVAA